MEPLFLLLAKSIKRTANCFCLTSLTPQFLQGGFSFNNFRHKLTCVGTISERAPSYGINQQSWLIPVAWMVLPLSPPPPPFSCEVADDRDARCPTKKSDLPGHPYFIDIKHHNIDPLQSEKEPQQVYGLVHCAGSEGSSLPQSRPLAHSGRKSPLNQVMAPDISFSFNQHRVSHCQGRSVVMPE